VVGVFECPACGHRAPTMDHLVDHSTDAHGWAVTKRLGDLGVVA
jgi:hypothetical protein